MKDAFLLLEKEEQVQLLQYFISYIAFKKEEKIKEEIPSWAETFSFKREDIEDIKEMTKTSEEGRLQTVSLDEVKERIAKTYKKTASE